jgi:pyruvate/2-oxoglutarate dehydrogenase complex dihydrolipoamide dehydrogenase (E3) component
LEAEVVTFSRITEVSRAEKKDGQVSLIGQASDGAENSVTESHLLLAVGRRHNSDGNDLDAAGFIKVSGQLETSVPGIWALGDVKGGPAFTHISYNDFHII